MYAQASGLARGRTFRCVKGLRRLGFRSFALRQAASGACTPALVKVIEIM